MARNDEDRVQASIVGFIKTVAPDVVVYAVPNGTFLAGTPKQRIRQAARLKWTGLLPGVFDLTLLIPGGRVACIEVKAAKGSLSPEQRVFRDRLIAMGIPHAVCRGIEDARFALAQWGVNTREASA